MKKKLTLLFCAVLALGNMSGAAWAAEVPAAENDPESAQIVIADTIPNVPVYPAEVIASEENGIYRLEKVYYLTAEDDPAALDGKASDKAAELLRRFEAKNGSVFCRELKGRDTGVVLRPCRGCVEDAAERAEEIFEEK